MTKGNSEAAVKCIIISDANRAVLAYRARNSHVSGVAPKSKDVFFIRIPTEMDPQNVTCWISGAVAAALDNHPDVATIHIVVTQPSNSDLGVVLLDHLYNTNGGTRAVKFTQLQQY